MVTSEPLRYHLDLESPWCDHFLRTDPALDYTPRHRTYQGYARVEVFTIKLWELDDIQLQKIEAIPRKHSRSVSVHLTLSSFRSSTFGCSDWTQVVGGRYNEMMYNSHDPRMVEEFQVCPDTVPMSSKGKPFPH